jgi:hypothetical protein
LKIEAPRAAGLCKEARVEAVTEKHAGIEPEARGPTGRATDLAAIAALMPERPLCAKHQVIVDVVVMDKPGTYRTAATGLARFAEQVAHADVR